MVLSAHSLSRPQLDPALWDPFEQQLLYHIYHDALPDGLGLSQVLQLAQLADRFQVGARVERSVRQLRCSSR